MEFLENYCSFSRLISKQDNVLLEFTTARLIAIYDSVLLQFAIAWLLQFSTTVITIYDRYYNSRHHYNSTQARRASCGTTVWNVRKESQKRVKKQRVHPTLTAAVIFFCFINERFVGKCSFSFLRTELVSLFGADSLSRSVHCVPDENDRPSEQTKIFKLTSVYVPVYISELTRT